MKSNILYFKKLPPNMCCNDLFDELENKYKHVCSVYKKQHKNYAYITLSNIETAQQIFNDYKEKYKVSYSRYKLNHFMIF